MNRCVGVLCLAMMLGCGTTSGDDAGATGGGAATGGGGASMGGGGGTSTGGGSTTGGGMGATGGGSGGGSATGGGSGATSGGSGGGGGSTGGGGGTTDAGLGGGAGADAGLSTCTTLAVPTGLTGALCYVSTTKVAGIGGAVADGEWVTQELRLHSGDFGGQCPMTGSFQMPGLGLRLKLSTVNDVHAYEAVFVQSGSEVRSSGTATFTTMSGGQSFMSRLQSCTTSSAAPSQLRYGVEGVGTAARLWLEFPGENGQPAISFILVHL